MRALTPKRILTNPFFSVKYFTLFCCINHATIVLIELCKNTDYYKVYLNQIISKVQ